MKNYFIPLLCFFLSSCSPEKTLQKYEESRSVYNEKITLDICLDPAQPGPVKQAMAAAWEQVDGVSAKLGTQDPKSDIYKINHSFGRPAKVGDDTYDLVKEAVTLTRLSEGTFDITVGALEDLWKAAQKSGRIPTRPEIKNIQKAMGPRIVKFHPDRSIELLDPRARLDLGGLAGGWAVDKAVEVLKEYGYKDFMVSAAGAMYMSGHNCEGKNWQIGVSNPLSQNKLTDMLSVTDRAVDTSGDYEKYLIINGQKYSHIYNPITGYPQKGTTSATIVAKASLVKVGALTIAGCVLSPQEAVRLIDRLGPDNAALILFKPSDDKIIPYESRYYKEYKEVR